VHASLIFMQLVLVRHGQSANNLSYALEQARKRQREAEEPGAEIVEEVLGWPNRVPDPTLTDLGIRQAQALGAALSSERPPFVTTHLYASPTLRAVATVRPLAEATGLPVVLQPEGYEVGGIQDFDERTGVREARPGATLAKLQEHGGVLQAPPGLFPAEGEPWDGGYEEGFEPAFPRARRVLSSLLMAHRLEDVVVLVSHQFFAQFVIAAAFGWDSLPGRGFRVDNTGHLSLRMVEGKTEAEWINRVDHLDAGDVTN
jgi:2,3-bisphosphoglycerate-dependent phosphoglycerate mutase